MRADASAVGRSLRGGGEHHGFLGFFGREQGQRRHRVVQGGKQELHLLSVPAGQRGYRLPENRVHGRESNYRSGQKGTQRRFRRFFEAGAAVYPDRREKVYPARDAGQPGVSGGVYHHPIGAADGHPQKQGEQGTGRAAVRFRQGGNGIRRRAEIYPDARQFLHHLQKEELSEVKWYEITKVIDMMENKSQDIVFSDSMLTILKSINKDI